MSSTSEEVHHGAFEGSIVRVIGDPVLSEVAEEITEDELHCDSNYDGSLSTTIPGACGAPAEEWVASMLQGIKETKGAAIAAP